MLTGESSRIARRIRRARIETAKPGYLRRKFAGIARRIRRARIETCREVQLATEYDVSPDELVGRGLKLAYYDPTKRIARYRPTNSSGAD